MNWKTVKLSEAYRFQEGPGVRKWQFTHEGIKLLNVANILKTGKLDLSKTDRHLSVEEATGKYAHFLVDAGDLVIASSGISVDDDGFLRTRGAFVYESHLPLCLNTSTIRFKAKEGISTLPFLKYWIDSVQFREQISRLVTGSAQKNFGPSHLKAIKIPLPPLAEQQRIAARLDAADRLRALRRDALARLDALTHSLFLEMFGDPAHNPMNWPVVNLANACLEDGKYGSGASATEFVSGAPRYIRITDIEDSGRLKSAKVAANNLTEKDLKSYKLRIGDVLFARSGATVGKTYQYQESDGDCVYAGYLIRFRPDPQKLTANFLFAFTGTSYYKNWVASKQQVVAQPNINAKQYGYGLEIPLPPLDLQRAFAARLGQIETVRARMETSALELDALFASLQSAAFDSE